MQTFLSLCPAFLHSVAVDGHCNYTDAIFHRVVRKMRASEISTSEFSMRKREHLLADDIHSLATYAKHHEKAIIENHHLVNRFTEFTLLPNDKYFSSTVESIFAIVRKL